jgi:hypothetical protein
MNMAKRKPRIVITIVTKDGSTEYSNVKGRERADGKPSDGPTEKQFKIARKAILDLLGSK